MVQIAIENLLSNCKNRALYESLWFLAFGKQIRQETVQNESVTSICDELLLRIKDKSIDARDFMVCTNLIFGTIRLYKAQVDKLCDQTKFALQSCSSSFYQVDWLDKMSQKTSTPYQKTQTSAKKIVKSGKNAPKSVKKNPPKETNTPKLIDDFEMIESIFNLDDDVEMETPQTGRRSKKNNKSDSAIDPTLAPDLHDITMKEPATLMSSGFHTMNDIQDDFDDQMGEDFGSLFRDLTAPINNNNSEDVEMTGAMSNLISGNRKRASNAKDDSVIKKRRLTYMNCEESMDLPRNVVNTPKGARNVDIYEPSPIGLQSVNDSNSFNDIFSAAEKLLQDTESTPLSAPSLFLPSMEIDFQEPSFPNTTNNEPTFQSNMDITLDQSEAPERNLTTIATSAMENNTTIAENAMTLNETEMAEASELLLEEVSIVEKRRRSKKSRSLVVDNQKIVPNNTVRKSIQTYKDKMTDISPFKAFRRRMHYFKSCVDVLFSTGSFRLQKSKLHYLYTDNMKKVPEKLLKKRENSRRSSNVAEKMIVDSKKSTPPMTKRVLRHSRRYSKQVEELEVIKEVREENVENISPEIPIVATPVIKRSLRSNKILGESNAANILLENDVDMLILPPLEESSIKENQQLMEIDLPSAIEVQNNVVERVEMTEKNYELDNVERVSRKKATLLRLQKFWQQKDQSVTLTKLCSRMERVDAASTFFELLLLAKYRIIDLIHDDQSLQVANILCLISTAKLSKEIRN